MTIELPEQLEAALKSQAEAHGMSAASYALEVLERDLAPSLKPETTRRPLRSGLGVLAKYGPAPTAEEIDANRADMFKGFGESY